MAVVFAVSALALAFGAAQSSTRTSSGRALEVRLLGVEVAGQLVANVPDTAGPARTCDRFAGEELLASEGEEEESELGEQHDGCDAIGSSLSGPYPSPKQLIAWGVIASLVRTSAPRTLCARGPPPAC